MVEEESLSLKSDTAKCRVLPVDGVVGYAIFDNAELLRHEEMSEENTAQDLRTQAQYP
jgi:hypothetical protein